MNLGEEEEPCYCGEPGLPESEVEIEWTVARETIGFSDIGWGTTLLEWGMDQMTHAKLYAFLNQTWGDCPRSV